MATFSTFPCGDLEKFVLSSNRRKLLGIERDDDTKQDPESATATCSLLHGSGEHTKYHLQQIENEITSILVNADGSDNLSEDDQSTIRSLLSEANGVINKAKKDKMESHDVSILQFRHRLRTLLLSAFVEVDDLENKDEDEKEEDTEDVFDALRKRVGVSFNHAKPMDVVVGGDGGDDEQKISDTLTPFDAEQIEMKMKELFAECKQQGDVCRFVVCTLICSLRDLFIALRRFGMAAVGLLMDQDFCSRPSLISDLRGYSKDVLAITDRVDLAVALLEKDSAMTFPLIRRHFNFTKHQMEVLADKLPKLWSNEQFACLFMEKSLPTQISFYLRHFERAHDFQEFLPRDLASKCFDILLEFARTDKRIKLSPKHKACVMANWMRFKLDHFVCCCLFECALLSLRMCVHRNSWIWMCSWNISVFQRRAVIMQRCGMRSCLDSKRRTKRMMEMMAVFTTKPMHQTKP